jgi:small subunit ribosomal protein S1
MSDRIRTIRRRKDDKNQEPTEEVAAPETVEAVAEKQPKPAPKKRLPAGPKMDAKALQEEVDALGPDAMAQLMGGSVPIDPDPGQQVSGTVASITAQTVFVNIGAKSEAILDRGSLKDPDELNVGDTMSAYVLSADSRGIRLVQKMSGSGVREMLEEAHNSRIPIEGRVVSRNPGGFNVELSGVQAFCPASQIAKFPDTNPDDHVGQTLLFIVTECKERDVVVSHRAYEEAEMAETASRIWEELKVGDVKEGTVAGVQDFGVFVELGGAQGLLHKTEFGHGSEVEMPAAGTVLTVRIKTLDQGKNRISLGLGAEDAGPWSKVGTDFVEGERYKGTVTRIVDYGAFVELAPGLEGMIHVSELADHRVDHPRSVVKIGQEVEARVLEIDAERKRLGLSLKSGSGDGRSDWSRHQKKSDKKQSLGTFADLLGGLKLK